jgi:hypothetical protein
VEQAVGALTIPWAQGMLAATAPGCATVDDETDSDGDFAPDVATYTFALPACGLTGFRGGMLEVTGTIVLEDPTPDAPDLAVTATLSNLAFRFTSPNATSTYSAVRNGTRTITARPWRVAQQRSHGGPEPAGACRRHDRPQPAAHVRPCGGRARRLRRAPAERHLVRTGWFTWSRGSVSRTFTVTTARPLVWEASCTTDRKIASGETHATLGDGSYIRTVWTGCGEDPTRSFVPAM